MLDNKEITKTYLEHYIDYTSSIDLDLVVRSSFFSLHENLLTLSENCIIEIKANHSKLDVDKKNEYLKSVKSEIEYNLNFTNTDKILAPYLEKYALIIDDFPFKSNDEVRQILSVDSSDFKEDNSLDVSYIKNMHLNFFEYAIYIETHKILDVINEELFEFNIFNSSIAKKKFEDLLEYLNLNDHKPRGNQAKLAAIWQCETSNKFFFKGSAEKKDYLNYLNYRFGSSYTTKRFSKGDIHEKTVRDWVKENCL